MNKKKKRIFWIASFLCAVLAILFFMVRFLPGFLMLLCAILINPPILERITRKKGLSVGLLIAILVLLSLATLHKQGGEEQIPILKTENKNSLRVSEPESDLTNEQATVSSRTTEAPIRKEAAIAVLPPAKETRSADALTSGNQSAESTETVNAPTPSPASVPKALPNGSEIQIISYPEIIGRGEYATIEILGEPNTDYSCSVEYKSGPSTAKGLGEKQSDSKGSVSWTWKIGTNTSLDFRPIITVQGGGDSVRVRFQVVE